MKMRGDSMKRAILWAAVLILFVAACSDDTDSPNLTIVTPQNNDTIPKGLIWVKVTATDNVGVTRVEFFDNDSLLGQGTAGTADTYEFDWDAMNAQNLSLHVFKAQAWDAAAHHTAKTVQVVLTGTGPTFHSGAIVNNQTWSLAGSPHIVQGKIGIGGSANPVLTIEPGCRVLFEANTGINCGDVGPGAIVANGTPALPILFSSYSAQPNPGDWDTIRFAQMTLPATSFICCSLQYGGKASGGMLYLDHASLSVRDCVIRNSGGCGVLCSDGAGFARFDSNEISGCVESPLRLNAEYVRTIGPGNLLTGNGHDSVEVDGGAVITTGTWLNLGVPYLVNSTVAIGDAGQPVLTIAPGATICCGSGTELSVGLGDPGGLIAAGVAFTSARNPPALGDWSGIAFYGDALDASCSLTRCRIEYGGGEIAHSANIFIQDALPEIRSDSIGHSLRYGILLDGTIYPSHATLMADNTFYDNYIDVWP
jgi:hypothetical protein